MADEEWRPVNGGRHEVSSSGHVRSVATGRVLRGSPNGKGYLRVDFARGHHVLIHVLVLEAFAGPCPAGCESRHLNGVRTDNRTSNLAWGTPAENQQDRERHGTVVRGERSPLAKLTEEAVREIRSERANGTPVADLAARYRVSTRQIKRVSAGRSWGHV